ncbi:hypothetical protein J2X97_001247 [Epilithonimonas hungarica]|uniref:hypothetical protein n=1 Tax=Epilithonimonas hungarica TaxID=454006 RepID=UPI002784CCC2|nr:hypothetical protein [Epilithonimonas hungarica]MDP9955610.1 hypothetical protein [Epilithonimonas hungarica]
MKLLKYFFLLFFIQYGFAQRSYRQYVAISGNITVNGEPENNFKIFLFDSKKNPQKSVLKFDSQEKSNQFRIELTTAELYVYKFIEIATTKGAKVFKISSLSRKASSKIDLQNNINLDLHYLKIRPDTLRERVIIEKPAIYLYPEKETLITVKHQFSGKILTTYPAYNDGWEVVANPKGILYNKADKRNYSYLFWDGFYQFPASHYDYKTGFYIEKNNYAKFLQEKLSYIGLNETEINDFVVYWLPQLNRYEKVFVHFRINDNIDNTSFLNISPKPDTLIRVFIEFKETNNNEEMLPPQILPNFERKKFVVVEWGGSRIKTNKIE